MSLEAFVTLATNDAYARGALVLAQSIRQVGTKRNLVVLISNHLSDSIRKSLERTFDKVIVVDQLDFKDNEHLELLSRAEVGIIFTKIKCWLLEQYSKCVFLDSDCLVLRSIDDLFQREEFSAAPDAGWPDFFNSGVFVYRPSKETFNKLMLFASQPNASFDGGDQGLLKSFFSNWRTGDISRHLPFTYNATANTFYSCSPAVTRFINDIHVVHFAGALKPWQLTYNPQNEQLSGKLNGQSDIQRDFLLSWWRIMHQSVWPIIQQFNQVNFSFLQQQRPISPAKRQRSTSKTLTNELGPARRLIKIEQAPLLIVAHRTASFKFHPHVQIRYTIVMPNNKQLICYSERVTQLPHVEDLDKIDRRHERYDEEHAKAVGAATTLFEICADVVHALSDEIYFVRGPSIKISKTNMNSFNVLQVQDITDSSKTTIKKSNQRNS